eukprot:6181840-Pleurochrysis_carterae.AAC.3
MTAMASLTMTPTDPTGATTAAGAKPYASPLPACARKRRKRCGGDGTCGVDEPDGGEGDVTAPIETAVGSDCLLDGSTLGTKGEVQGRGKAQ